MAWPIAGRDVKTRQSLPGTARGTTEGGGWVGSFDAASVACNSESLRSQCKWGQRFRQPHVRLHCFRPILGDRRSGFAAAYPLKLLRTSPGQGCFPVVSRRKPAFIVRPPRWRPVPSGGRFRPCDLSHPPGGSVTAWLHCRSGPCSAAPKCRFPFAFPDRLAQRPAGLRASRCICGSLCHSGGTPPRVFRRCCGHRCQILTFAFSLFDSVVSHSIFKFGFTVSMT